MSPEKTEYLLKTYQQLFAPEPLLHDMQRTLMCFGFECGDGWYQLIESCLARLAAQKYSDFEIVQVKEKFGSLRIYFRGGDSMANQIVSDAAAESSITCEACGTMPAKLRSTDFGWLSTRCEKCVDPHCKIVEDK
jgi:hypothetical protein